MVLKKNFCLWKHAKKIFQPDQKTHPTPPGSQMVAPLHVISPSSFFFDALKIPKVSLSFEKNRLLLGDLITEKYELYE